MFQPLAECGYYICVLGMKQGDDLGSEFESGEDLIIG